MLTLYGGSRDKPRAAELYEHSRNSQVERSAGPLSDQGKRVKAAKRRAEREGRPYPKPKPSTSLTAQATRLARQYNYQVPMTDRAWIANSGRTLPSQRLKDEVIKVQEAYWKQKQAKPPTKRTTARTAKKSKPSSVPAAAAEPQGQDAAGGWDMGYDNPDDNYIDYGADNNWDDAGGDDDEMNEPVAVPPADDATRDFAAAAAARRPPAGSTPPTRHKRKEASKEEEKEEAAEKDKGYGWTGFVKLKDGEPDASVYSEVHAEDVHTRLKIAMHLCGLIALPVTQTHARAVRGATHAELAAAAAKLPAGREKHQALYRQFLRKAIDAATLNASVNTPFLDLWRLHSEAEEPDHEKTELVVFLGMQLDKEDGPAIVCKGYSFWNQDDSDKQHLDFYHLTHSATSPVQAQVSMLYGLYRAISKKSKGEYRYAHVGIRNVSAGEDPHPEDVSVLVEALESMQAKPATDAGMTLHVRDLGAITATEFFLSGKYAQGFVGALHPGMGLPYAI